MGTLPGPMNSFGFLRNSLDPYHPLVQTKRFHRIWEILHNSNQNRLLQILVGTLVPKARGGAHWDIPVGTPPSFGYKSAHQDLQKSILVGIVQDLPDSMESLGLHKGVVRIQ